MNTTHAPEARLDAAPGDSDRWLRIACLVASLLASWPALRLLSYVWTNSDYLAHGYLIPLTSLGLVWLRRERIAGNLADARTPPWGPPLVLAAALLQAAAVLAGASTTAGIGIVSTLAATIYAVGGRRLFRTLLVPVAFLLLMVPPPIVLQDRLLFGLKGFVIHFSVAILQAAGYSVAATGNRLFVPGHELFVADACSGLTSIVTLLPLGVVVAYLLSHGLWRRLVIIGCVVPIALVANLARVVITVALVASHGIGYSEGLLHESFGMSTFLGGTVILLAIAKALR
jgi:exosortase